MGTFAVSIWCQDGVAHFRFTPDSCHGSGHGDRSKRARRRHFALQKNGGNCRRWTTVKWLRPADCGLITLCTLPRARSLVRADAIKIGRRRSISAFIGAAEYVQTWTRNISGFLKSEITASQHFEMLLKSLNGKAESFQPCCILFVTIREKQPQSRFRTCVQPRAE
jgi:hypothetical protein